MRDDNILFSEDIYWEHLATINGIKLTRREIDIIACLLSARGTSKIASFLSIATRTVETHIRNIMLKLECNSRESIIDFIERSHKLHLLRDYYASLVTEIAFQKSLIEISKLKRKEIPTCLGVYWKDEKLKHALLHYLNSHLIKAAIKVEVREYYCDQKINVEEIEGCTLILLLEKNNQQESIGFDLLDLSNLKNYYLSVFEILKKLFPQVNLESIVNNFWERVKGIQPLSKNKPYKGYSQEKLEKNRISFIVKIGSTLSQKKGRLISAFSIMGLVGIGLLTFKLKEEESAAYSSQSSMKQKTKEEQATRSDLIIPKESTILNRPELIAQINEKFKKPDGIQTVSLVGTGGAGKTTLARQYANQQNAHVIWEINAETQESLKASFENLANTLAKTEEDKRLLRSFQEIKDTMERERKIIQFVKGHLKFYPNWFLIFDNVEKFTDIQKYFPQDSATWGEGSIILTTRDRNIQNNPYVDNVIQIGELSPHQKLDLFMKIMNHGSARPLKPSEIEEIKIFLEKIPPFPLDICIAAYYLKTTNISYGTYLESLVSHNSNFEDVQQNLLKETGDYTKTRYGIISVSLQHIISENKDFQDLLLLISLIDSQNIPRDLLDKCKNKTIVDNFIYNLKKHSLITNEETSSFASNSTISIHRSSQAFALLYLTKLLNLEQDHTPIKLIADKLEMYLSYVRDKEDPQAIKDLINHCEQFLKHNKLLNDVHFVSIESTMGSIYFYSCNYERAKELLEECIAKFKKHGDKPHDKYFDSLVYLGNVHLELGNFETAQKILEESVSFNDKFPQNHDRIALALVVLGNAHRELGNYKKAKNLFEQGLVFYKKHIPKNDIKIAWTLTYLGNINKELGNFETAKGLLEQSLEMYEKIYGKEHLETAWVIGFLGILHREMGNCKQSIHLLEKSIAVYKKYFPENFVIVARIVRNIGKSYLACGDFETAEKMLNDSLEAMKEKKYPKFYMCLEDLSELYVKKAILELNKNNTERCTACKNKSIEYLRQALDVVKTYYPKDSPHVQRIQLKLADQKSGIMGK